MHTITILTLSWTNKKWCALLIYSEFGPIHRVFSQQSVHAFTFYSSEWAMEKQVLDQDESIFIIHCRFLEQTKAYMYKPGVIT
jgi:hypothetical protein